MKTIGNQLYSNLALGYTALVMFSTILYPNPGASLVSGLHIALGFFVFFQLELGRSQFNNAVIALYACKLFFLQEVLFNFDKASFHTRVSDFSSGETSFSDLTNLFSSGEFTNGPEFYFYGILYLIPLIYLLLNMDQWLPNQRNDSGSTNRKEETILSWIPFATIALILGFNAYAGLKIGGKHSLLNLEAGLTSGIPLDGNLNQDFRLDLSFVIIPVTLTVLYLLRKVYQFGLLILSVLVLHIVFVLFQQAYFSITNSPHGELFPTGIPTAYVFVEYLLPTVALVAYIYYFRQTGGLKKAIAFLPLTHINENSREEVKEEENRPEISFNDFVDETKHLLVREARPVFLALLLLGLALITGSFLNKDVEYIPLCLGFGDLALLSIFMSGVRSNNRTLIQFGFYGLLLLLIIPIILIFEYKAGDVLTSKGIFFLNMISLTTFLISGINIVKAVQSDENYAKFVSNRNNTRIFNLKFPKRFSNNVPRISLLDNYAGGLIPWQQRKVYTFILMGTQAYLFITTIAFYSNFTGLIQYNGFFGFLANLSFTILLLSYYLSIIRWHLILNINFCIVAVSMLTFQLSMMVYNALTFELNFENGFFIFLLAVQLIVFIICLIALNEQKMKSGKQPIANAELLDE